MLSTCECEKVKLLLCAIYVARVIATYVTFYHKMTAYKCSFVAAY